MQIHWESNKIYVSGNVTVECLFAFSQGLYVLHTKQGYEDIVLDFANAEAIFESFMVPALAQCRAYSARGVNLSLLLPANDRLRRLFHNGNWAHLIDNSLDKSTFSGYQHLPAAAYTSPSEQYAVVNQVMDVIIGNLAVERRQLKALEWCINEVTDNVLNHAQSDLGGIIQASTFPSRNAVEFAVADAGIGVRASLGGRTDEDALSRAIQEGVTRNSKTNQGNGLYGSFRVAALSGGHFQMHSGRASLVCRQLDDIQLKRQKTAIFSGTAVTSQILCDNDKLIEEALVFKGQQHEPAFDYVEQKFDPDNTNRVTIRMRDEATGFGTREAGRIVSTKVLNLVRADDDFVVELDFSDVLIISSSFADEAVGKLFIELGPIRFMNRIRITNADATIRALLDRAIVQRSRQL